MNKIDTLNTFFLRISLFPVLLNSFLVFDFAKYIEKINLKAFFFLGLPPVFSAAVAGCQSQCGGLPAGRDGELHGDPTAAGCRCRCVAVVISPLMQLLWNTQLCHLRRNNLLANNSNSDNRRTDSCHTCAVFKVVGLAND